MKCLVIQLSDIHIKGRSDPILSHGKKIAATAFRSHIDCDATFIVLSGDIAFSGKWEEYLAAEELLKEITTSLLAEKPTPIHVVAVPGNHDCDFAADTVPRKATIEFVLQNGDKNVDGECVSLCTAVQNNFFAFLSKISGEAIKSGQERLYWSPIAQVGSHRIHFHCLNVSWLSRLDEVYGRLHFPTSVIRESRKNSDADIDVFVFHHPLNWFTQDNLHELRSILRSSAEIVLTGHEHVQGAVIVDDALGSATGYIEGGALASADGSPSSFNLLEVDLFSDEFRSCLYEWTGSEYVPRDLSASWSSFRPLPSKKRIGFEITDSFNHVLRDAGANFTHPIRGALTLDDIFVYPDLRELTGADDEARSRISANTLLGKSPPNRVFLIGDEKCGKTSLLYQLYRGLFEQGVVPVYVRGIDIGNASKRELDAIWDAAVVDQLGAANLKAFWETPARERVCFLDDYDRVRLNEKYRAKVIEYISSRFGRSIVVSSDGYQLVEYLSGTAAAALSEYQSYAVLPFGHHLRLQLIRKWTCGGVEAVMPLGQMTELVDRAERVIDSVLGNNFVPAVPLYILTLLQSLEAGRSTEFSNSAFGHYYTFLISRDLSAIHVKPEEFDELFNYCAHLAQEFSKSGKRELEVAAIRRFNAWYSETYTPIAGDDRIQKLCEARVLMERRGVVQFRYPYYRYYFLGKYFADGLGRQGERSELMEQIRGKCRNLHIRENANAILFLTHHSKEPFVLGEIVDVLKSLFAHHEPIRFSGDVQIVSDLVDRATKMIVEEWDVEKNRDQIRKLQDEIEEREGEADGGSDAEQTQTEGQPPASVANLLGQVNLVFKTIELLGQVLKNYYGSLRNEEKIALMQEIFRGPLRALADFFSFLAENKDALVFDVEADLARRHVEIPEERRQEIARRTVFNVVGILSCIFVGKAADAVNAKTLRDNARTCAEREGTPAAKIIQVAAILDSADQIPYEDLSQVIEMIRGDIFAKKIIESFAFRHVYLFPTSIKEKQQLQALLEFDVRSQRALDVKSKDAKMVVKKDG